MALFLTLLKIISLGIVNALGVWGGVILYTHYEYRLLILLVVGLVLTNVTFIPRRKYHLRYIFPGAIFMIAMVIYPLFYTVYISFTNYGTGHLLHKEQVIERNLDRYYQPEDPMSYTFDAFVDPKEQNYIILLEDERGNFFLARKGYMEPIDPGDPLWEAESLGAGIEEQYGYRKIDEMEIFQHLSPLERKRFEIGDYQVRMIDFDAFARFHPRFEYCEQEDALFDFRDEVVYYADDTIGAFITEDSQRMYPGYRTVVGFDNFMRIVRDPRILNPFLRVFSWTFQFAFLTVATTFLVGLFLAIILNDPHIRGKLVYRILLILPYAIPAFISALVWRGFFNMEFGVINQILGTTIPWLHSAAWARLALIILNLWLGFPYMMIICLGALQSIKQELYEAAVVDGASIWQQFRHITFPLLLTSVAPLLVASFAFNFNNFSIVYLLTEGRPPIIGARTPAGHTDILISYTYRLAFESGRGTEYGMAAAVTLLIFIIIGTISWFNYRFTGALEELKEDA